VELEVAMRLAHPAQEKLAGLALASVRCGGTGVRGHQYWEDVGKKLMISIGFQPLESHTRYIAARVVHALQQQKEVVVARMASEPLHAKDIEFMRSNSFAYERIFYAYDSASREFAEHVLKLLQSSLTAGCISPDILLRAKTTPDVTEETEEQTAVSKPSQEQTEEQKAVTKPVEEQSTKNGRLSKARQRVMAEIALRNSRGSILCGVLPKQVRAAPFDPTNAFNMLPEIEKVLLRAFRELVTSLACQAVAFVNAGMTKFSCGAVDSAMETINFTPEQSKALTTRYHEMRTMTAEWIKRANAVNSSGKTLRRVVACDVGP
jgi:hypothetical protein